MYKNVNQNINEDSQFSGTAENLPVAMTHQRGGEDCSSSVCIGKDHWPFLLHIDTHCCLLDHLFSVFLFTPTLLHCSSLDSLSLTVLCTFPLRRNSFDSLVVQHGIEHFFLSYTIRFSPHPLQFQFSIKETTGINKMYNIYQAIIM